MLPRVEVEQLRARAREQPRGEARQRPRRLRLAAEDQRGRDVLPERAVRPAPPGKIQLYNDYTIICSAPFNGPPFGGAPFNNVFYAIARNNKTLFDTF